MGEQKISQYGKHLIATIWAFLRKHDLLGLLFGEASLSPSTPPYDIPPSPLWMDPFCEEARAIRSSSANPYVINLSSPLRKSPQKLPPKHEEYRATADPQSGPSTHPSPPLPTHHHSPHTTGLQPHYHTSAPALAPARPPPASTRAYTHHSAQGIQYERVGGSPAVLPTQQHGTPPSYPPSTHSLPSSLKRPFSLVADNRAAQPPSKVVVGNHSYSVSGPVEMTHLSTGKFDLAGDKGNGRSSSGIRMVSADPSSVYGRMSSSGPPKK
jgi:hypothetical protein